MENLRRHSHERRPTAKVSHSLAAGSILPMPTLRQPQIPNYLSPYNAFTCAVTVIFSAPNSSVGALFAAAGPAMSLRIIIGRIGCASNVSTEAYDSTPSDRPLP